MNDKQFRKALAQLNLTRTTAVDVLGLSDRQIRRIEEGQCAVPGSAARLLALMIKYDINPVIVKNLADEK